MDLRSLIFAPAAVVFMTGLAFSQQTTEQFIPIGQSPGASERFSIIGEIVLTDPEQGHMLYASGSETVRCVVTAETRIYIDRSKAGEPSLIGDMADLEVGRRVEVKYYDAKYRPDANPEIAEWIKVEVMQ